MSSWLHNEFAIWGGVVRGAAVLLAIVFVLAVYARSRSFVALIVAMVTAGIFLWGINNVGWFQQRVQDDVNAGCHPSTAVTRTC